ncbi:MAG: membrane protein insertase YidC [Flavobacteriales bacterium]|nr:membrane protein insertase YidC [Flavobacteriales bacterium]
MDKKSITGLLIIGAILIAFSLFNAGGSKEEENPSKKDSAQNTEHVDTTEMVTDTTASSLIAAKDENGVHLKDSATGAFIYTDTISGNDTLIMASDSMDTLSDSGTKPNEDAIEKVAEKTIKIENDLIIAEITNHGGRIKNLYLKEYKTYNSWQSEKDEPLQLFDENSTYGIDFFKGDKRQNSADYNFKFVESSANSCTVEMISKDKKVGFKYALKDGKYDMDFSIYFKGFKDQEASDISFVSDFKLLSTEKHLPSERRVSTVFFKYNEDSYDYLSIGGDDDYALEEKTAWVAYKQSYFSAILMSDAGFPSSKDSKVEIINLPEEDSTYIKQYRSNLNLGINNMKNTVDLKWYFGPNDYDLLSEYGNGSEDIVDLGWGLFRWINVWAIRPLFKLFMGLGWGAGLAILLLTIIVKIILSPVNYKMYKSSAMMRVLKPEIEKISKKFPKKEDAMKKQQATMALYRETGVSPMAGCVPMLIQMPILFAIFRLFPSAIELRQQGFLWAEDLSTYDSILNMSFSIPLYGDHVSLFTLLMAITTLAYTHYNSQNMTQPTAEGMPNMKYIMYFFPIMMIFFFNSYSSGLSYYYFISTLMTMGIMFSIKRFMIDDDKIHAQIESNKQNPKKKGKSKFAQRLEEAQKLQQDRMKNRKG